MTLIRSLLKAAAYQLPLRVARKLRHVISLYLKRR